MAEKILDVQDLKISFSTDNGVVKAVRGVSFDLERGETLCIVGESGSGKSVTSKAIMGILAANAIVEGGKIMYQGENLLEVSEEEFHTIRGHKIGMIFQDPLSSLNPIVRIGKQITEATLINSNKLKTMYSNIISAELTAYKNTVHRKNLALIKAKDKLEALKKETSEKLKDKSLDQTVRQELKDNLKQAKADYKEECRTIKESSAPEIEELKAKLDSKKEEAKKEVSAYKESIEKEYADSMAKIQEKESKLNAQYANASTDQEKAAYATAKKELAEEKKEAKLKKVNALKITRAEAKRRALEIMKEVGIPLPEKRFRQYPFEFSGGMRQRIVIAIALTATPEILICDEPTTALDVTIQAQILELIKKIQKERNIACIFITHDLGVVANMADRVAVMYAGKIVEYGKVEEIFFEPKHPYTWALLSSIPDVDSKERLDAIPGTPPNMIYPPKGDAFALRSKYAMKIDFEHEPPFFKVSDTHYAATWLLHPDAPKVEMPKIVSERIKNTLGTKAEESTSTVEETPVKETKKAATKKSATKSKTTGTKKTTAKKSSTTKTTKKTTKEVKGASSNE
ncbi:MAG: ATP-binding cassette domain-containing protein [Anaeroplasmataceae bacterium]|nr:ATP-binding cassette domain-containing protein [Anaeroplasmataceae bacterium]MDE7384302.1 ATP-binding cassette domain-containing protein [Anaeroplasmataceae bacterium]